MRDILTDLFQNEPTDPVEVARRSLRRSLRKRFYKEARVGQADGDAGTVLLDGKPVRTPARRPLAAPVLGLAEQMVAEWNTQGETIEPAAMPLTRLANSVIDGVTDAPGPVRDEIAKYLGSDLLFYRAEGPDGLVRAQTTEWDPLIAWARDTLGARFMLTQGVMFLDQTPESVAAATAAIPSDPWRLGAVHSAMTLTGSALIALALAHGRIDLDQAWRAAHVDEDWNIAQWGADDEAVERRGHRLRDMQAAAVVLDALRESTGGV